MYKIKYILIILNDIRSDYIMLNTIVQVMLGYVVKY